MVAGTAATFSGEMDEFTSSEAASKLIHLSFPLGGGAALQAAVRNGSCAKQIFCLRLATSKTIV